MSEAHRGCLIWTNIQLNEQELILWGMANAAANKSNVPVFTREMGIELISELAESMESDPAMRKRLVDRVVAYVDELDATARQLFAEIDQ